MFYNIWVAAELYGPLLLFGIAVIMIFRPRKDHGTSFTFQPLGFFGISMNMNRMYVIRCLLGLSALGGLSLYALIDYSRLFPEHLTMDVYFDTSGLARVL